MNKKCYQPKSISINVEAGKYYFCTCGHSTEQPFCDDSHDITFKPKRFTFSEAGNHSFCLCKESKNMPFCDGSHRCLKTQ
eukprot:COSAG01_NODE_662_length_14431_cov_31.385775_12_plen_80_part_00